MNTTELRDQFPILSSKVYGKQLVYFDNAATSQRPLSVVQKWEELSLKKNANLHRAVHHIAEIATEEYENTREYVRSFINAEHKEEIIFTSGTTHSINIVAFSFGEAFVHPGDEIIVSEEEHHSNIVPWQMMCQRKGAVIKVLHVDDSGHINPLDLESLITPRTVLVAVTQVSNVLGLVNPIAELANISHSHGVKILVDGAQGIVHQGVDVQKEMCDFYTFSGHKIYAAPGTGVLYGKKELLDAMPPYMGGGEMIDTVKFSGTTYASLPQKFEAGTQNMAGVPTLIPAIEMSKRMRDPEIVKESEAVKEYMYDSLTSFDGMRLYGVPHGTQEKIPLFSFSINGVHHEDLALILDKMGIAVRSGQMCAEPIMDRYEVTGMLRVSLAPYNTMQEAEYFIESLKKAVKMLK